MVSLASMNAGADHTICEPFAREEQDKPHEKSCLGRIAFRYVLSMLCPSKFSTEMSSPVNRMNDHEFILVVNLAEKMGKAALKTRSFLFNVSRIHKRVRLAQNILFNTIGEHRYFLSNRIALLCRERFMFFFLLSSYQFVSSALSFFIPVLTQSHHSVPRSVDISISLLPVHDSHPPDCLENIAL
jgi:hypothetical protein